MGYDQRRMISGSAVGSDGLVSVPAWLYYTFDYLNDSVNPNVFAPDAKAAELGLLGELSSHNTYGLLSAGVTKWGAGCLAPEGDIFYENGLPSDILSGDRTIEFWAYVGPDGQEYFNPFVHLSSSYGSTNGDHVGVQGGSLYFNNGNQGDIDVNFPTNEWFHVACVVRGPARHVWINENLLQTSFQMTLGNANVAVFVGGYGNNAAPWGQGEGDYFIDDLRITKAALYWPGGSVPDLTGPHGATAKYKPAPFSTAPAGTMLGGYLDGAGMCDFYEVFSDGLGGYYSELVSEDNC